ncbi:DUF1853 family protein [Pokkaliibacter sp. CJK22405]|uniref:DUF1853 family protein n=1 Tax=Pokkaliibacter sp. CJK22405 TaxID=3384615 RepID=UPI0039852C5D
MTDFSWRRKDIDWLCSAPALLHDHHCLDSAGFFSYALPDILPAACVPGRLGIYAEVLMLWLLQQHPELEAIADHLQIQENQRTLGELDFLLRWKNSELWHLELAVKWYLFVPELAAQGLNAFVGPDIKDTLAVKYQRLIEHQLPISKHPEITRWLHEHEWPEATQTMRQLIHMPGRLFYPLGSSLPTLPELNPEHHQGRWLKQSQLPLLHTHYPEAELYQLVYRHWLGGPDETGLIGRLSDHSEELLKQSQTWQRPVRLMLKTDQEHHLMVVPDTWHQRALEIHLPA